MILRNEKSEGLSNSARPPELSLRLAQAAVVAAIAFLFTLIVFNNVTDYGSNFAFVQHVFLMDTTFPGATTRYRAITHPLVHHAGYLLIIVIEAAVAGLCWRGSVTLFRARRADDLNFRGAKSYARAGLTLAYLLMQVGVFALGNEWFGMWMSREWTGAESIFRFVMMTLGALIFVSLG